MKQTSNILMQEHLKHSDEKKEKVTSLKKTSLLKELKLESPN